MTISESGAAARPDAEQGTSAVADLIERVAAKLGARASVSAVYGEPIDRDGVTIIPVARVSLGFGAGAGTGHRTSQTGQGGGGGGGAAAVPIGYIEIKNGNAVFKRVLNPLIDLGLPLFVAMVGSAAPRVARRLLRRRSG